MRIDGGCFKRLAVCQEGGSGLAGDLAAGGGVV